MIFIGEETINAIIAELETANSELDERLEQLKTAQPILLAYITSEQFDMLNTEERDYLVYLAKVLYGSIAAKIEDIPKLTEAQIGSAEEENWGKMETAKGKTFRDKLDAFFENYEQEDLLAFVEDSLAEDEDSFITSEGRELMFVGLKSLIDAFHKAI